MSLEHRFVFADNNVLLRCKYVDNEYVPIEMVDFDDIIGRLKKLVFEAKELRRNSGDDGRRIRSSSLIERLDHLFEHRRNSSQSLDSSNSPTKGSLEDIKTESVMLPLSPNLRNNRKFNNKTKINLPKKTSPLTSPNHLMPPSAFDSFEEVVTKENKKNKKNDSLFPKKSDIIACLDESPTDFVHVLSFNTITNAEQFLQDLYDLHTTVGVEIDVSTEGSISISYQKLSDFKFDFMMVDLSRKTDFMLFLKPF